VDAVSVPVSTRLDEQAVDALDRAVALGLATTRAALVATAVAEWISRHGEEAIVESYRRRYDEADRGESDLIAGLGAFSAAACLDHDGR
jgi:hypothetical protein